jgi:hypothetical protein
MIESKTNTTINTDNHTITLEILLPKSDKVQFEHNFKIATKVFGKKEVLASENLGK